MTVAQSPQTFNSTNPFNKMTSNIIGSADRASLIKHYQHQLALRDLVLAQHQKQLPIKAKKTTTKKPKRSVRFSNMASVTTRPTTSKSELDTMWYHDNEYTAFDQERRRTIAAIKNVNGDLSSLDPTVYCVRGLEQQLSTKQVLARRLKAKQYTHVVLRQQYVQKRIGRSDPDRLQAISEMFSRQATQRAHLRGVIDHALM